MGDLLYLVGTVGFFALMLGYLAACERLGRRNRDGEGPKHGD